MASGKQNTNESLSQQLMATFNLTRDPFSKERSHYFTGAQRDQNLDSLRHLLHFGDLVLLVTGEKGSGKTTLLGELLLGERDTTRAVVVKASLLMGADKFVQALAAKLQVVIEKQLSAEALLQCVFFRAKEIYADGKRVLLVVDDVQDLSDEAVLLLLSSLQKYSVKEYGVVVVFSAPLAFVQKISNVSEFAPFKKSIHQIQLKPLSRDDTENYVKIRLLQAGAEKGLLLSEAQVERLYAMGKGNPGRINRVAPGILLGLDAPTPSWFQRIVKYRQLFISAAVAASVLIFSLILVSEFLYDSNEGGSVSTDPALMPESVVSEKGVRGLEFSARPSEAIVAEDPVLVELQNKLAMQESRNGFAGGEAEVEAEVGAEVASIDDPVSDPDEVVVANDSAAQSTVAAEVAAPLIERESASLTVDERNEIAAVQPIDTVSESAVSASVAEAEAVQPIQQADAKEKPGEVMLENTTKEKIVDAVPMAAFSPRLPAQYKSMDWLLAHSPSSSVVQLLGSYNEETAVKFLKQYEKLGFFYVQSTYKGKEWFVVLDGVYNDKAEARDRISAYPKAIQKQEPWVRSVSGF